VSWQTVEDFAIVVGPSVATMSAASLCDIWAVGRQIIVGDLLNFTAHLQAGSLGDFEPHGDVNGDHVVTVADLLAVIADWGDCAPTPAKCPGDVNFNATVNVANLLMVINHWG